jgi:hypothetical protein
MEGRDQGQAAYGTRVSRARRDLADKNTISHGRRVCPANSAQLPRWIIGLMSTSDSKYGGIPDRTADQLARYLRRSYRPRGRMA